MTTDEMIETMARAIYEADDPWHTVWPWPDLQSDQAGVDQYRRIARAALAAILPVLREEAAACLEHEAETWLNLPVRGSVGRQGSRAIRARFDQIAKEIKP